MALSQRFNALTTRVGRAKDELNRMERALAGQGTKPPAELYAARDRLDRLIAKAAHASGRGANEAEPKLAELDGTVAIIEKYLKMK